jgi:hypothetical protein
LHAQKAGKLQARKIAGEIVRKLPTVESLSPFADGFFTFSEEKRAELLKLLGPKNPQKKRKELLDSLATLVNEFRKLNSRKEEIAPAAIRAEIASLIPALKDAAWGFYPDSLSHEAWDLLEVELVPILAQWINNPYEIPEASYRIPSPMRGYQRALYQTFFEILKAVEVAAKTPESERKGGRPKASAKQKFVTMAVESHLRYLEQLPATTKESDFEEVVRQCLDAAGFAPGKVHDFILAANRDIKARRVPKPAV